MSDSYILGETLDDLLHSVIEQIRSYGGRINPTKGPATELTGVLLELGDPRARLSRTETRGRPYSCLGELCWYLASTNDLDFISYYIPAYLQYAEEGIIFGGYGPRLFNWRGLNQVRNVTDLLRRKPDTRQAVVQMFDCHDLEGNHKDVPCTCTLQFLIRSGELRLVINMRSNDAFLGLPHDIFCFTMLQEIVARSLDLEMGSYKHMVGSLHLYDANLDEANQFLAEGWQSTQKPMPPMPLSDQTKGIASLLEAESAVRMTGILEESVLSSVDPYWADLMRLLQIFRCKKDQDSEKVKLLRESMVSKIYSPFIDRVLREIP